LLALWGVAVIADKMPEKQAQNEKAAMPCEHCGFNLFGRGERI
jgi:hypothetical protein